MTSECPVIGFGNDLIPEDLTAEGEYLAGLLPVLDRIWLRSGASRGGDALDEIARLPAQVIVMESEGGSTGAVGVAFGVQEGGRRELRLDVETLSAIDPKLANVLAGSLECAATGRFDAVRISATGPFPCPTQWEFAEQNGIRNMTRQIGAVQLN